ncbi:hypothetical protein TI06_23360, partial [Vibrio vulnificus]
LQAEEAAFPQAERAEHGAEEDHRNPAGGGFRPAAGIGEGHGYDGQDEADQQADTAGADHILLHERRDFVQMALAGLRVLFAE